jgi:protocatechuate 3,4-dioxygenase, beta subunit
MPTPTPWIGRRDALIGLSALAGANLLPSVAQAQTKLSPTPKATEGPYYPKDWRGDIDNDLVTVQGEAAKALGQVMHIEGRVLDISGQPIAGAMVEIWQCEAKGIYRHPADESSSRRRDGGFQGRGRTPADSNGHYRFRTIRPVAYATRTPHIHFKVTPPASRALITQLYVFGEPQNERDFVLNAIRDPRQRDSVIVRLQPADRIEAGALAGSFDIFVG